MTFLPSPRAEMQHQVDAFERFKDADIIPLWWQQRCRKTSVILKIFRYRYHLGDVDALMVLADPKNVEATWLDEIEEDFPPEDLAITKTLLWQAGKTTETVARRAEALALRDHRGMIALAAYCGTLITVKGWKYINWLLKKRRVMLVADECFTADTLISTSNGPVRIENVKAGDLVITPSGLCRVLQKFNRESRQLALLYAAQEVKLRCTPNHPLFTDLGWVCAGNTLGRMLIDDDVVRMWEAGKSGGSEVLLPLVLDAGRAEATTGWSVEPSQTKTLREQLRQGVLGFDSEQEAILLDILRSEMAHAATGASREDLNTALPGSDPLRPWSRSLEHGDSSLGRYYQEAESGCQDQRCGLSDTWWQRAFTSGAAAEFADDIRPTLEGRASHRIGREAAWLSNLLQGRFSIDRGEACNRGRWVEPQQPTSKSARQEEGRQAPGVRVDRVGIEEFTRPIPVFDLQLEGDPRYYANGVLVHNSSWMCNWNARTRRMLALGSFYKRPPKDVAVDFSPTNVVVKAILDGTPADESPDDVYYPTQFLRRTLLGFDSPDAFRARYHEFEMEETEEVRDGVRVIVQRPKMGHNYLQDQVKIQQAVARGAKAEDVQTGFPIFKGYRNLDELQGKLATIGSRILRADVSKAPPPIFSFEHFDLTEKQRRVYDRVLAEYVLELSTGEWPLREVLKRVTRLQQIGRNYVPPERVGRTCTTCDGTGHLKDIESECERCEGFGIAVDTTELERIDDVNPAADRLGEWLLRSPAPVVVWARFRQDVTDAIDAAASVGRTLLRYDGLIQPTEREANYRAFRAGEADGIAGIVTSGLSRGKNLTRAHRMAFYSNWFGRRARSQAQDRCEALDRTFSTEITDLVARDTRDQDAVDALCRKGFTAATVMGDFRRTA